MITTTVRGFLGGRDAVPGRGRRFRLKITGSWQTGDKFTLFFSFPGSANRLQVGAGMVTGVQPTGVFVFKNRVYVLAGDTLYFSAVDAPTVFNDPTASGNGFIRISDVSSTPDEVLAVSSYQGQLAVFCRNSVQIWETHADPANFSLRQTLSNIGVLSRDSVQPIGDLDVYFLSRTGFRSLRVRDASNNAFINDVGTPVDVFVQGEILNNPEAAAKAISVVEPSSNRYWCYFDDKAYVLTDYKDTGIVAWSHYTFPESPEVFVVYNGTVWFKSGPNFYYYSNSYDNTEAEFKTWYMDFTSPATRKQFLGLDVSLSGEWSVTVDTNPGRPNPVEVYRGNGPSYWHGRIPFTTSAWFLSIGGRTLGGGRNTFDGATILFRPEEAT